MCGGVAAVAPCQKLSSDLRLACFYNPCSMHIISRVDAERTVGAADVDNHSPQRELWVNVTVRIIKLRRSDIMSRTFTNLLTHLIFSTKDREPLIRNEIRSELFAYLGGLTRELKGKAYGINGTNDHVHMLQLAAKRFDFGRVAIYQS